MNDERNSLVKSLFSDVERETKTEKITLTMILYWSIMFGVPL